RPRCRDQTDHHLIFSVEPPTALPLCVYLLDSLPFFTHAPPPRLYALPLHDALPISPFPAPARRPRRRTCSGGRIFRPGRGSIPRSEEHTSELQSRENLVCRLLLEKKKKNQSQIPTKIAYRPQLLSIKLLKSHFQNKW